MGYKVINAVRWSNGKFVGKETDVLIIWKGIPYATQEAGNLGLKKSGGACCYLDGFDTGAHTTNDATFGGLIGMLLGIIGGPIGVLLGGSYGTLVGATVDAGDAVYGASMLDQMADKLDDGMVALIALAAEETDAALDKKLSKYDTVIARFDAWVVADEVDKAYEKQAEMARLARMEVRKQQEAEFKAQMEEDEEILRHGFTK